MHANGNFYDGCTTALCFNDVHAGSTQKEVNTVYFAQKSGWIFAQASPNRNFMWSGPQVTPGIYAYAYYYMTAWLIVMINDFCWFHASWQLTTSSTESSKWCNNKSMMSVSFATSGNHFILSCNVQCCLRYCETVTEYCWYSTATMASEADRCS